jgi:hypothetical protein
MTYIINKTNGDLLTTLIDGSLDDTTDLTLIGKNFTGYGEQLNENFVKLLENFSSVKEPAKPITGQVWFDLSANILKVYTPTGWKTTGGPLVTDEHPLDFNTGDLWIDSVENQLWYFTGSDLVLAGPIWKRSQGKTGFVAETLYDRSGNPKAVLYLYVANSLLGAYSAEAFVPVPAVPGFADGFLKGYTSNSQVSSIISGTASNSEKLNNIRSSQFMRSDVATVNSYKILIQNDLGLTVGTRQVGDFKAEGINLVIENTISEGDIVVKTNNDTGVYYPIYVDSGNNRVGLYTMNPEHALDVAGNVRVRGDLIVEGSNTTINSTVLKVEDKSIELAVSDTPSDLLADGGGIVVRGTTDKTILYTNSNSSFTFSENINLQSGKHLSINGSPILTSTTISVANAPNLISVGNLTDLVVANIAVTNNRISSVLTNQDIELNPQGTGNIALIGTPRVTGLGVPVDASDAVPKVYSDFVSKIQSLSISMIDNGLTGPMNNNIILFLQDVAPAEIFVPGKLAYVHVQHLGTGTPPLVTRYLKRFVINPSGQWQFDTDLPSSI